MFNEENHTEVLNLIGYGLAKFDKAFANEFGFTTKNAFSQYIVDLGLAKTIKAVTNRQDSFDPYFDNGRKGWYQRNQREHIKLFIDSLFGNEDVQKFANIVKLYIQEQHFPGKHPSLKIPPTTKSKFKNLQETGREAEFFFVNNYKQVDIFANGVLEDARLWGDGYDFQILIEDKYLLAEVKGVRQKYGSIRMTECEYKKAQEYLSDYILVVVSNLSHMPKISLIPDPISKLSLVSNESNISQRFFSSEPINWQLYENTKILPTLR